jgi:hypothetical protein
MIQGNSKNPFLISANGRARRRVQISFSCLQQSLWMFIEVKLIQAEASFGGETFHQIDKFSDSHKTTKASTKSSLVKDYVEM